MEKVKFLDQQLISMKTLIIFNFFCFFLLNILHYNSYADETIEHKIAVLVNEELITSYDIIQRMKLTAIIQGMNINADNNKLIFNNTVDELIHEKLKIEKIKEYEIVITNEEYQEFENNFFNRNNIKREEMLQILEENKINYQELKNFLINDISWNKLINGLFLRLSSANELEVNEILSKNPNITIDQARNYAIQRQVDLKSSKMLRDMLNESTIEYK